VLWTLDEWLAAFLCGSRSSSGLTRSVWASVWLIHWAAIDGKTFLPLVTARSIGTDDMAVSALESLLHANLLRDSTGVISTENWLLIWAFNLMHAVIESLDTTIVLGTLVSWSASEWEVQRTSVEERELRGLLFAFQVRFGTLTVLLALDWLVLRTTDRVETLVGVKGASTVLTHVWFLP